MLNLNFNWPTDVIKTITQWWPVIKSNLQQIQDKVNGHFSGETNRHKAEDIDYSGSAAGKNVKEAINNTDTRISNLVITGTTHDPFVTDALIDIEGENFGPGGTGTYLNGRHGKWENRLNAHMAENVSVSNYAQAGDIDDTAAINRALAYVHSKGGGKVRIPYRTTKYTISSPLIIYSNIVLEADKYAEIYLKSNSNCRMLENANKTTQSSLTRIDKNIAVIGGIWDGNGDYQTKYIADGGTCTGFLFSGVDSLVFMPTKIVNTQTYASWFCNVNNVLIKDMEVYIPAPAGEAHNQDGIHIQGPSSNITVRDCTLKAHDNVIALNADDVAQGTYSTTGDITDVLIDNINLNDTYQGMLLLSATSKLDRVRIQNITGKAQYLLKLWTWNLGTGNYGDIAVENVIFDWTGNTNLTGAAQGAVEIEGKIDKLTFKNIKIASGIDTGFYRLLAFRKTFASAGTNIKQLIIDGLEASPTSIAGTACILVDMLNITLTKLIVKNIICNTDAATNIYPISFSSCIATDFLYHDIYVPSAINAFQCASSNISKLDLANIHVNSTRNIINLLNTTSIGKLVTSGFCDLNITDKSLIASLNNQKIGVKSTANQAISTGAYTDVLFQSLLYGESAYFTSNKNLVAKTDGLYLAIANVRFAANATGQRAIALSASNGEVSEVWANAVSGTSLSIMQISLLTYLIAGQSIKLMANQNSGANLNIEFAGDSTNFKMVKVG